ncbi:MerR family transcriptional regulator [Corynebacterium sp.]|uniref:MerR family transcriptional regulator n=1 Tax=Corynebacterium sp. TaxID=1720 RepID=UPI0026E00A9D|nr:MerR family transcriptional regulator [Corynebacterium sp.]MDO5512369.1 MerR family transcriptional regulator [Corynebacterium sp.]
MKLQELSAVTGVTVASIKYYLREGVLHPGAKKNATTAVYDDTHRARLDLIQALRQIVGAPVGEIRRLTALIDTPAPAIDIMSAAQALGAGAQPPGEEPPDAARELVGELMSQQGWPDRPSAARRAVESLVAEMAGDGYLPSAAYLGELTRIIDELSALDLQATDVPTAKGQPGDLDRLALRVAVGTWRHSRLLVAMLQLGHTSHSLRQLRPGD